MGMPPAVGEAGIGKNRGYGSVECIVVFSGATTSGSASVEGEGPPSGCRRLFGERVTMKLSKVSRENAQFLLQTHQLRGVAVTGACRRILIGERPYRTINRLAVLQRALRRVHKADHEGMDAVAEAPFSSDSL